MKISPQLLLIVTLFLCTNLRLQAQEKTENVSVNYTVKYNESDYKNMQQKVAKTGISARDFGSWLASNGTLGMEVTGDMQRANVSNLVVLVINSQGNILGEERIPFKNNGRDSKLNTMLNSSNIV